MATSPAIKCFVSFRLRPHVSVEDYLRWFRTVNLAAIAELTAIRHLRLWRRMRVHEGHPTWELIEEMDVLDLERCQQEFTELPAMQAMLTQWYDMVADHAVVFAEEVPQRS